MQTADSLLVLIGVVLVADAMLALAARGAAPTEPVRFRIGVQRRSRGKEVKPRRSAQPKQRATV
jgi:hypothetical protein